MMKSQPPQPDLGWVEAEVLGAILGFHRKVTTLLREASLNGDKLTAVMDRIKTLIDDAADDMKRTREMDLGHRMELAFEEVKMLVTELSHSQSGGSDTKAKPKKHRKSQP